MKEIHAHEVLHMMEGHNYSEETLKEAIIRQFGEESRFYTCSANNMDIDTLIVFLKRKGKFLNTNNGFTVDTSKVCNH
ncbi:YecH family metal-binding protein [Massilibacteroides sp.]|uniref:YecH family metal-binding protein n=1 Tax=Massilibacteroides sp. TaxID=2034766 RepID=UPI0026283A3D|nr:YecH family metal-binding protein [Massilibacteroides sp.]MDD4516417.1 YecH family protein [Massilibacteroides sp.]